MKPPVTIWKSSLSAAISLEAADDIIRSDKVRELLRFLKLVYVPDVRLWMSAAGNPSGQMLWDNTVLVNSLASSDFLDTLRFQRYEYMAISTQECFSNG